ncbi:MAG TPA: tryptophan 2,3-dioxygenase family protein [Candidatus Dormibacteraeota bacterium]|jgi:tryptophan 2,3-dioxygenase|nr:tryptophan 2,3-dioxygenase family protein [Candidatus Dormibacteraeota bacterium]
MTNTEYHSYLLIDDLLRLQRPLTEGARDELLFIVVHQVYELWFRVVVDELIHARDELLAGRAHTAIKPLRRVLAVEGLLIDQLGVLETMGPEDFLAFRDPLAPASGFQSAQFRAIERLSGGSAGASATSPRAGGDPGGPSLWEAFCACARAQGIDLPEGDAAREERLALLADLYRDHAASADRSALHTVAELLCDHDEAVAGWRFRHALMAARTIGARPGTGGSVGVEYLRSTVDRRFFPELWDVRTRL